MWWHDSHNVFIPYLMVHNTLLQVLKMIYIVIIYILTVVFQSLSVAA